MPRKDRKFTSHDIARLFCNNLSIADQVEADDMMDDCEDFSSGLGESVVKYLVKTLAELFPDLLTPEEVRTLTDVLLNR